MRDLLRHCGRISCAADCAFRIAALLSLKFRFLSNVASGPFLPSSFLIIILSILSMILSWKCEHVPLVGRGEGFGNLGFHGGCFVNRVLFVVFGS